MTVDEIISNRRSVKPEKMNGRIISTEEVEKLLLAADWAPTHGRTEPWRFIVFDQHEAKQFCSDHAELYKQHTSTDKYQQATFDKLFHKADKISHLIVAYMKRGENPKITTEEEYAATACAIENLLLSATAHGIASFWSTGGLTHHPALHHYFDLDTEDKILSLIHLGYNDEPPAIGVRRIPLSDKVKWIINGK